MVKEKWVTINEKVQKLRNALFITKVKCPFWLDNMVLVRKSSNKWYMCVYYMYLNIVYLKDPYLFPNMYWLIDGSSNYKTLSFVDA